MLRLHAQTEGHFYYIFHATDHHFMYFSRNAASRRVASYAFGSSARAATTLPKEFTELPARYTPKTETVLK